MMKTLVGIIVEAKDDGTILPTICQFPIERETDKLIYVDTKDLSYIQRRSLRSLSQIRKDSMGLISTERYSTSFHFQIHGIVENSEHINALIETIKFATEEELRKRIIVSRKWEHSFAFMHIDMEVK